MFCSWEILPRCRRARKLLWENQTLWIIKSEFSIPKSASSLKSLFQDSMTKSKLCSKNGFSWTLRKTKSTKLKKSERLLSNLGFSNSNFARSYKFSNLNNLKIIFSPIKWRTIEKANLQEAKKCIIEWNMNSKKCWINCLSNVIDRKYIYLHIWFELWYPLFVDRNL